MTAYQYYEFLTLDRPLTPSQMDELREYSSGARISPTKFVDECHWGEFRGDPERWMEEYFDAFLCVAEPDGRSFMLRVPRDRFNPDTVSLYCSHENLHVWSKGDYVVIAFSSRDQAPDHTSGRSWLKALLPIRSDLICGDHRALYLGWLLGVQSDRVAGTALEPPIPPGLGSLSQSLVSLAGFLGIDSDLVAAAAERSPTVQTGKLFEKQVETWIRGLAAKEKDALLAQLITSEDPRLAAELRQRAAGDTIHRTKRNHGSRRTASKIRARAKEIGAVRGRRATEQQVILKARLQQEQEEQRKKHLESLSGSEGSLWAQVEMLVAARQPARYDKALTILRDLHDLADLKGNSSEFSVRMAAFCTVHARKTKLIARVRAADLMVENLTDQLRA